MDDWLNLLAPYHGVGLALALGALIGVERGWSQRLKPDGSRVAGVRTFALLGLTGGLAGEAARLASPLLAVVLIGAAAAALLIGYARDAQRDEVSATTTVVGLITLGVGLFAALGQPVMASVIAAVITLLLSTRRKLHGWVGGLSEVELHAITRFALIALAVLPLLPNEAFGPYGAWNPRSIWMVVVLVSGLSLLGYWAAKRLGPAKGVLATAAAGALVSSTAVTAAMAARLRDGDGARAVLVAGVALASLVMFLRVVVLVAFLAPFAVLPLSVVALPAAAVNLFWILGALRRSAPPAAEARPTLRNPFDLGPAVLLAALVMAVSVVGRWALDRFGSAGLVVVLTITGLIDVDSAVLGARSLPAGSLDAVTAGLIFSAPLVANSLLKAGLVVGLNGGGAWRAAAPLMASVATALAAAAVLPLLFG
jgi:uncharacterized membrane protein (DUF4010 family)